ncbi:hypothetical protein QAD02_012524 [Eretmocerus hayati]|uniref:Uncharacterized protein n=1 Tax=Eretmocerus hayati TaxID=131215 RepID=A0ACC2P2Q8_9HYME|nr:hypothetical protein QAD02_012524 [Eretmocerus hayati]
MQLRPSADPAPWLLGVLALLLIQLLLPGLHAESVRQLEVSENAPPGSRVGFIDADGPPPYLIVPVPGSAVESDLSVDQTTGEIRTRSRLDRESRPSYSLVALPHNVRVVVRVLDENDNAPSFPAERVLLEFPENAPRDSRRALPPARDPDLGAYSTQAYEIVAGNEEGAFKLAAQRGRDGVLYLDLQNAAPLDRERRAEYNLVIEARDGGSPPLRSRLHVDVRVQDANDNPPVFVAPGRYEANIPENATVGTPVVQVRADDADESENGRVEYSINRRQSDREELFRIDPDSGWVYVNKPLDFEARERHELVLVARDRGAQPLEASALLAVRVLDVNDNQPQIELIFLSDDGSPRVSESARPGEIVARVSVNDPDSPRGLQLGIANATLSLNGGEGHFGLASRDNVVYLLLVERPLDRERRASYDLELEATDAGEPPLRASRAFRLVVADANDNAPRFLSERYEAHLLESAEPGSSVARVRAEDADEGENARVSYALAPGNASRWFAVEPDSGLVTTAARLDCETDPAPLLWIIASDAGRPQLSASASLRVTVHDLNDNEPVFEKPLYNVSVPENLPPGRCFVKVTTAHFYYC